MSVLSSGSGSQSDSSFSRKEESFEESFGWYDTKSGGQPVKQSQEFNQRLIQLANEKVSLKTLLEKYQVTFQQKYSPSGWTHFSPCPFPDHSDRTPSFGYHPKEDRFNCFGCSKAGRAVQFWAAMERCSQSAAAQKMLGSMPSESVLADLELLDDHVRDHLRQYSEVLDQFAIDFPEPQAIAYMEAITWPLDAYIRNHLTTNSIDVEQLAGRIQICLNKLEDYGDE